MAERPVGPYSELRIGARYRIEFSDCCINGGAVATLKQVFDFEDRPMTEPFGDAVCRIEFEEAGLFVEQSMSGVLLFEIVDGR